MTDQFCVGVHDARLLTHATRRMTDADHAVARMLASIELFGEPNAEWPDLDARMREPIPSWAQFLAYNLRDPANRAALIEALGRG